MTQEKLTLEHLAPYLPHKVKGYITNFIEVRGAKDRIETKLQIVNSSAIYNFFEHSKCNHEPEKHIRLQLRPLSYLDCEIEHNGMKFVPIDWLENEYPYLSLNEECYKLMKKDGYKFINHVSHLLFQHLVKWHFDVYGLIPKCLAEPIPDVG